MKGKAASRPADAAKVQSRATSLNEGSLKYKAGPQEPRFYGCVTIYTNNTKWRVKPAAGRRDEKTWYRVDTPRTKWLELVKHVKSLRQY